MKSDELRRRRRTIEHAKAARGRALEEYLAGGGDREKVVPELIPDAVALTNALREARRLIRLADRTPRGARRSKLMDEILVALARLVFVERVMALDPLERAGLTPSRLAQLSMIGPWHLRERLAALQGVSRVEVAER